MRLLSHQVFSTLRLSQFLPAATVHPLENWELHGHLWRGEANGFTSVLQLETDPDRTRVVEIALAELPAGAARAMLQKLGLQVVPGASLEDVTAMLGPPAREYRFVPDRSTFEWEVGPPEYTVGGTFLREGGLVFLTVRSPLPPVPLEE